jgi:hypothetical protein
MLTRFALLIVCVPALELELSRSDLSLRVDTERKLVHGVATLHIKAAGEPVSRARFSLNDRLVPSSVQRDGSAVRFERGERIAEGRAIEVVLEPPLPAGAECRLTFEYEGLGEDPDEQGSDWMGILLVREDEVRMSHQAQWCPIVPRDDAARSKLAAPIELELDLPAGFESLGPGTLRGVKKSKGREVHSWSSERPVQPSILAGKFRSQSVKRDKTTIRVLSFPEHASGAKAWAEDAGKSLEALGTLLGKLDVASYGLGEMRVRNRSKSYNYEADGFSVYDGVLFDGRAPDARKIAHEVGHLWFGAAADASGPGERFLTEGLAEHAAWLALESRSGEGAAIEAAKSSLGRYFGSTGAEASLVEADFSSPRYSPVVYAKGAFALRTLRAWIGPDPFLAGLRAYVAGARSKRGAATLEDFLAAMRTAGGAAVDAWAEDWLRRAGAPTYAVELTGEKAGKLVQKGALYHNPVELELVLGGGKKQTLLLTPSALEEPWTASVPAKIDSVTIDPRMLILFERPR